MTHHPSQKQRQVDSAGGRVVSLNGCGTRLYNDSEIASLRQQAETANKLALEEVARRGIKLHPRVAQIRAAAAVAAKKKDGSY